MSVTGCCRGLSVKDCIARPYGCADAPMWEILNYNNIRWGSETYPTREAAQNELRTFWKGVHGVDLKKFSIVEVKESQVKREVQP